MNQEFIVGPLPPTLNPFIFRTTATVIAIHLLAPAYHDFLALSLSLHFSSVYQIQQLQKQDLYWFVAKFNSLRVRECQLCCSECQSSSPCALHTAFSALHLVSRMKYHSCLGCHNNMRLECRCRCTFHLLFGVLLKMYFHIHSIAWKLLLFIHEEASFSIWA